MEGLPPQNYKPEDMKPVVQLAMLNNMEVSLPQHFLSEEIKPEVQLTILNTMEGSPSQNYKSEDIKPDLGSSTSNVELNMEGSPPQNINSEALKPFRDFLTSYNKLSEICFTSCVWDFTSRKVKNHEERCAMNCTEKYMKMVQRISERFQEFQMLTNENTIAAVQKLGGTVPK